MQLYVKLPSESSIAPPKLFSIHTIHVTQPPQFIIVLIPLPTGSWKIKKISWNDSQYTQNVILSPLIVTRILNLTMIGGIIQCNTNLILSTSTQGYRISLPIVKTLVRTLISHQLIYWTSWVAPYFWSIKALINILM